MDKVQPETQRAQSLMGEISGDRYSNHSLVRISWKLRKGDPPLARLWTGALLEGHFALTEDMGWAGLRFWCLEMTTWGLEWRSWGG